MAKKLGGKMTMGRAGYVQVPGGVVSGIVKFICRFVRICGYYERMGTILVPEWPGR